MKVAIIGKNSYIGNHVREWLSQRDPDWEIVMLGARDGEFETYDYAGTDVVLYAAGVVHHPEITDWDIYQRGNADLPVQAAMRAKTAGVRQFLFLSTMGVYGLNKQLKPVLIDSRTEPDPSQPGYYGRSKLQGERALKSLEDNDFTVTVVRPPNVYGKGCRGGYITGFASIVRKFPFIPEAYANVKQSVIYIDNLCCLIEALIQNRKSGTYMPQDESAVSAAELMTMIADGLGLKRKQSAVLGAVPRMLSFLPIVRKAYGGIEYSLKLSQIPGIEYQIVSSAEGIRRTLA